MPQQQQGAVLIAHVAHIRAASMRAAKRPEEELANRIEGIASIWPLDLPTEVPGRVGTQTYTRLALRAAQHQEGPRACDSYTPPTGSWA
jgi:hypothetical protein